MRVGGVAQLGERLVCNQEVIGSNPFTSTRSHRDGRSVMMSVMTDPSSAMSGDISLTIAYCDRLYLKLSIKMKIFMVKLLRAHGGCLGARRR